MRQVPCPTLGGRTDAIRDLGEHPPRQRAAAIRAILEFGDQGLCSNYSPLNGLCDQRAGVVAVTHPAGTVKHCTRHRSHRKSATLCHHRQPGRAFDQHPVAARTSSLRRNQDVDGTTGRHPAQPIESCRSRTREYGVGAAIPQCGIDPLVERRRPTLHHHHAGKQSLPRPVGPTSSRDRLSRHAQLGEVTEAEDVMDRGTRDGGPICARTSGHASTICNPAL